MLAFGAESTTMVCQLPNPHRYVCASSGLRLWAIWRCKLIIRCLWLAGWVQAYDVRNRL
jgi:hypothetical protein